jgi:hypothetical protein
MANEVLQVAGIAIGAGGGLLTQLLAVAAFLAALAFATSSLDAGDGIGDVGGLFAVAGVFFLLGTLSLTWFGTRQPSGVDGSTIASTLLLGFAVTLLIEAVAAIGSLGLAVYFLAKGKLWRFGGSLAGLTALLLVGGAHFVGLLVLVQ